MPRYIDIEGAGIGRANREQFLVPEFADGWNAVLKILDKEPPADVQEVKHGKWIKSGNEKKCSVCEFVYYSNNDDWNGCPNCLAKMDGEKK